MSRERIQTDSSSIMNKVKLRKLATKELNELMVLDLFAGNNVMWKHFDTKRYYGVEIQNDKGKNNLYADNTLVIPLLDLSEFNVIDLDSYGIPFDQFDALFKNPTLQDGTVIIYTMITSAYNTGIPKKLMKYYGYEKMIPRFRAIFSRHVMDMMYGYLHDNGIISVQEYSVYSTFEKHYGFFIYRNAKI